MEKERTVWENRPQQKDFARKTAVLLEKKFGSILIAKYQGAGEIAILVLVGRGVSGSKMEEVRDFLKDVFKFELHKIKNHSHVRGTIIIHISEISCESRKIVEDEMKNRIMIPERIIKAKTNKQKVNSQKLPTQEVTIQLDVEEIPQNGNEIQTETETKTQNLTTMEQFSIIKKGRYVLSVFLTAMFRFEGIILSDKKDKIFSFDEKRTDDCQTISFRNEAEAEMGHKALTWYYGESKDLPILEKMDVMVNFFSLSLERSVPKNISFCFPPVKGDTSDSIKKRVAHLFSGYTPSSVYVIDECSFSIEYSRLITTQKFFELITSMGWNAFIQEDLIICKFRVKPEITDENTPIAEASTEKEEVSPITESTPEVKEVAPVPEPVKKVLDSNFVSPRDMDLQPLPDNGSIGFIEVKPISIKDLFSQAEAILKFKEVYDNESRWSPVPSEKKAKIIEILRNDLRSSDPQVFAKYLLSLYLVKRPLFTTEEAIVEFKLMMASSDFSNYSVAIKNGIISAMKDSLSDDELLDGLLDLF